MPPFTLQTKLYKCTNLGQLHAAPAVTVGASATTSHFDKASWTGNSRCAAIGATRHLNWTTSSYGLYSRENTGIRIIRINIPIDFYS